MIRIDIVIPRTFDQWHYCVSVECGIALERGYVESRLRALRDAKDWHTRRFIELYGPEHLARVIQWFDQARHALPAAGAVS